MQKLIQDYIDFFRFGCRFHDVEDVDYEDEQPESVTVEGWAAKDSNGSAGFYYKEPYNVRGSWHGGYECDIPECAASHLDSSSPRKVSITITFHK